MLRFENQQDFLEINLMEQLLDDSPSKGDARLAIRVSANRFSGHSEVWVLASTLQSFCQCLMILERDRHGETVLESISPEELRLVVRSVDSRGHMQVEGSTGSHVWGEHCRAWHSVTFGFEFDPSQLVRALAVDWVRANS